MYNNLLAYLSSVRDFGWWAGSQDTATHKLKNQSVIGSFLLRLTQTNHEKYFFIRNINRNIAMNKLN